MKKKNSWIALFALTVGLAGFYPAYTFLLSQSSLGKAESLLAAKGMIVGEDFKDDKYFLPGSLPDDMVTSEGAFQFKITLKEALQQAPRIAAARGVTIDAVEKVILSQIEFPTLTLLGKKWVHVLELNLALDQTD